MKLRISRSRMTTIPRTQVITRPTAIAVYDFVPAASFKRFPYLTDITREKLIPIA